MIALYLFVLQFSTVCRADMSGENVSSTSDIFKGLFVKGEMPRNGDIPLLNRKVFRGTRVPIKEHPYVVSIRRMVSHYLIATLLTRNTAITVAHPIYQIPVTELRVIAGENYCDRGTSLLTVLLVIIHEDFNPSSLFADLALIRIYEDLKFKISVKAISLIFENQSLDGRTAFVTGWGRCDRTGKELCLPRASKFYDKEIIDPMLRNIKFTFNTSNQSCELYNHNASESVLVDYMNYRYSVLFSRHKLPLDCDRIRDHRIVVVGIIKQGMLCLGESRLEDMLAPCLAVPGAPLVVDSSLAALQSWGYSCGYYDDMPTVYTSIREYQRWILHNIAILGSIPKGNLTDIFKATKAEVLSQWLIKTRMVLPIVSNSSLEEIRLLNVDIKLSQLNGTVFDVRDFMYSGKYHKSKRNLYARVQLQATSKYKGEHSYEVYATSDV